MKYITDASEHIEHPFFGVTLNIPSNKFEVHRPGMRFNATDGRLEVEFHEYLVDDEIDDGIFLAIGVYL